MHDDPIQRFRELFEQAKTAIKGRDYNAMTVASVSEQGRPSARVVLLKDFSEEGFVFYTNLESRKGRELLDQEFAALCFWWPELEYQIRIEGTVTQVPDEEADAYFASRPRGSQIGAWASRQSEPLPSREELFERVAEVEEQYKDQPVPRPPHWSGLRVQPLSIEFWKNETSRLHQRWLYQRTNGNDGWTMRLLYP